MDFTLRTPPLSCCCFVCLDNFLFFVSFLSRVLPASCETWRSLERCPDVNQSGE